MKRFLFILLASLILVGCAADGVVLNRGINESQQIKNNKVQSIEIAQRGCCSWHGGVCGCNWFGVVICCDGTLSPTCRCR